MLGAVALAALAVSLVLALAVAKAPRTNANGSAARSTQLESRFAAPAREPTAEPPAVRAAPAAPVVRALPLWALLAPWTFTVDATALLGLAAIFIGRYNARRHRRARR